MILIRYHDLHFLDFCSINRFAQGKHILQIGPTVLPPLKVEDILRIALKQLRVALAVDDYRDVGDWVFETRLLAAIQF